MINYLAVLAAAVAAFVFGFLWHGPVFGKLWMSLSGITQEQMEAAKAKGMGAMKWQMLGTFLQQLLTAYVFALFAMWMGFMDVSGALQLAFWSWLGFIVTTQLNGVLWENRSKHLYLFNITYQLASFMILSLIVTLWK